ncbi:MAG: hypothetical protein CM1200mP41_38340 [Gammaproteobacteria bacterium]|nr:MAG: hypothetical protein CM1200mP41_38340 [Gammaproteobacteria bacterium]
MTVNNILFVAVSGRWRSKSSHIGKTTRRALKVDVSSAASEGKRDVGLDAGH